MIPITKPSLSQDEAKAVEEVILSGWIAQGPKVKAFEEAFAEYVGAPYACAVANCTCALHLALLAAGVKPGDHVITVSHSFISSTNVVRYCQAHPLFVDIDLDTYNVSVDSLKQCIAANADKHISAMIVVHQMGMPCDMNAVMSLAREHGIPVVEDAACAVGSEVRMDTASSWQKIGRPQGDIACFSFHPRKLLTCAEGGMVTTRHDAYDAQVRLLRHQGMSVSDLERHGSEQVVVEEYPVVGYNYRMTDMQAAMGLVQLTKLPAMIKRRREIAALYQKALADITWLALPVEPEYARTNWQSFPIRVLPDAPLKRNPLMQYLLDHGVATRPGIMNAHKEAPYQGLATGLVHSEAARKDALLIPLYPSLEDKDVYHIVDLIRGC
jgi:dTDP-4-amino-4,6-dideoxygalactose transaminase